MKDKIYPAIYKSYIGALYLYTDENNFCELDDNEWLTHSKQDAHQHSSDKNITREYLEGKCVKIESPEHSEFVQKLAFNAGFKWSASGRELKYQNSKFLSFHKCGLIGFADYSPEKAAALEETTIPLPPKAEPDPKEWPQVGDEVITSDGIGILMLPADKTGCYIVEIENNALGYQQYTIDELEKPKTEAEILRDEFISDFEKTYQNSSMAPSSTLSDSDIEAYAEAMIIAGWKKLQ